MIRAGLVALVLALGGCSSATATVTGPPDLPDHRGRFVVSCAPSHADFDDPLVFPGRDGASHLHEFFGNVAIDAGELDRRTTAARMADADTTCETAADRASYWVPALLDEDGERIAPEAIDAYYRAGRGVEPTDVDAYPHGLGVIAGGGPDRDPPPTSVLGWSCSANPRRSATPPDWRGCAPAPGDLPRLLEPLGARRPRARGPGVPTRRRGLRQRGRLTAGPRPSGP